MRSQKERKKDVGRRWRQGEVGRRCSGLREDNVKHYSTQRNRQSTVFSLLLQVCGQLWSSGGGGGRLSHSTSGL